MRIKEKKKTRLIRKKTINRMKVKINPVKKMIKDKQEVNKKSKLVKHTMKKYIIRKLTCLITGMEEEVD